VESLNIVPIGRVISGESDVARVDWAGVESTIELHEELAATLLGLDGYSHVIVVGWLDRIPDGLNERRQSHPAGDERLPLQGALALRGARPNPLSVTVCELLAVDGASLRVRGLDLIAGTPVLDVKPYVAHYDAEPDATIPGWAQG
jgi:tRNA (Thr-GGU) A37 N-methylase